MIELSKRIQTIIDNVEYKEVVDVATDHAYIAIGATMQKGLTKVVATDLNREPLEKAKQNIKAYKMDDIIVTRLGSGFSEVSAYEVETGIVAGLGGLLMIEILEESIEVVKSLKQLVLQPQTEIIQVKKYIHSIGYSVKSETVVSDAGKWYVVINAINEKELPYSEEEYVLGKNIDDTNGEYINYIKHRAVETEKVVENLKKANDSDEVREKLEFYVWLNEVYNSVL